MVKSQTAKKDLYLLQQISNVILLSVADSTQDKTYDKRWKLRKNP